MRVLFWYLIFWLLFFFESLKLEPLGEQSPLDEPCFSFDYELSNAELNVLVLNTLTDELNTIETLNSDIGRAFIDLSDVWIDYYRVMLDATLSNSEYKVDLRRFNTFTDCDAEQRGYNATTGKALGFSKCNTASLIFKLKKNIQPPDQWVYWGRMHYKSANGLSITAPFPSRLTLSWLRTLAVFRPMSSTKRGPVSKCV